MAWIDGRLTGGMDVRFTRLVRGILDRMDRTGSLDEQATSSWLPRNDIVLFVS